MVLKLLLLVSADLSGSWMGAPVKTDLEEVAPIWPGEVRKGVTAVTPGMSSKSPKNWVDYPDLLDKAMKTFHNIINEVPML